MLLYYSEQMRDKKRQVGSSWHERGEDEEGERDVVGGKELQAVRPAAFR